MVGDAALRGDKLPAKDLICAGWKREDLVALVDHAIAEYAREEVEDAAEEADR
jgi:hypothetical protein